MPSSPQHSATIDSFIQGDWQLQINLYCPPVYTGQCMRASIMSFPANWYLPAGCEGRKIDQSAIVLLLASEDPANRAKT